MGQVRGAYCYTILYRQSALQEAMGQIRGIYCNSVCYIHGTLQEGGYGTDQRGHIVTLCFVDKVPCRNLWDR